MHLTFGQQIEDANCILRQFGGPPARGKDFTPSTTCSMSSGNGISPQTLAEDGDLADFELPPSAVPLEKDGKVTDDDTSASDGCDAWSHTARLPQLRVRAFRASPLRSPMRSPDNAPRRRSKDEGAAATRAQLREGGTGVEDVLNRVRYDLCDSEGFQVLVDNVERPNLCRAHLLRAECRHGSNCRHHHGGSLRWRGERPLVSSGSVPHVEALGLAHLWQLLDSAPCSTARHSLLQTVAFLLYQGEVVWSRHVGRTATQQLWDSFLASRFGRAPSAATPSASGRAARGDFSDAAELVAAWPGAVWERVLEHLQDPCLISGAACALLCSCQSMQRSALGDESLWEMLGSWTDGPALTQVPASPFQSYTSLAKNLQLYRVCWEACQGSKAPKSPCLGPEAPRGSPSMSPEIDRRSASVELGFEVSMLRGNASLAVAACRRSNELRLFQSRGLGRLPALRVSRNVEAFDMLNEKDALVVGGADGQLMLHAVSDPKNCQRLARLEVADRNRDALGGSCPTFAGLHFLHAGSQVVVAARSQSRAQLLDVATASEVSRCNTGGPLLQCELLGNEALLFDANGTVKLWDLRTKSPVTQFRCPSPGRTPSLSVNVGSPACAILSTSLHWLDLRAGHATEARPAEQWPGIFQEAYPGRLVMAIRGLVAAWFDGPAPVACWFGAGPAFVPIGADYGNAAVTAAALPLGGGAPPFAVALARPSRRRRRLVYELCAAA
ncbi:unnamed protein product [Effrenium voratum]|uniref:C3H1-type domain-containing protein n=1 Tax=Effrenium voratum TaxID=2562239 RepID=A0AA36JAB5_9DINO|nr:unnamed protein product [Effrenium voratum]